MSRTAPPDEPEARTPSSVDLRSIGTAARGGAFAYLMLVGVCQILALIAYLLVGVYGVWSWAKIGLLTASASLRADVIATVGGASGFPTPGGSMTLHWRYVPMLLTIGYLWLAARAGRRAARERPGRSVGGTVVLAAAGAAIPAAALGTVAAWLVTLSFPSLALTVRVDAGTAALWSAIVTAAGAGAGAYLEAASGRASSLVLRAALAAYGWMLVLIAGAVVALATLEPEVTRAYADGLRGMGAGGGVLFAFHVLAFPAQSAVLFAPATGSCLDVLGESGPAFVLCPWSLAVSGPAGELLLPDPVRLSPWLWMVSAVPGVAAFLGGRRASGSARASVARGAIAGVVFGVLGTAGATFAAPRLSVPFLPLDVRVGVLGTWVLGSAWGIVGGALGGWFGGRRYEEPELPSPTSV